MASSNHKRILVLDGLGFRGLGVLRIIECIVQDATLRAKRDLKPCDIFDLMCGTSIGGLIAVLLGRLELSCEDAVEVYRRLAKAFCGENEQDFYSDILQRKILCSDRFETVLRDVLKDSHDLTMLSHDWDSKAFVTVTTGRPQFSDHTHAVRSYRLDDTSRLPPRITTSWTISEAVKATMASPIYMAPAQIQSLPGQEYVDPSFSSFLNPFDIAMNECKMIWPDSPLIVVSIGTSLSTLCPPGPPTESYFANPAYVAPLAKRLLKQLPKRHKVNREIEEKAAAIARQLAIASNRAQLVHRDAPNERDSYFRLDPVLPQYDLILCDVFDPSFEEEIQKWISEEGVKTVQKFLQLAVPESTAVGITVEEARARAPIKPESGTVNPNYNPVLDQKRPDNFIEYLRDYHVLFIVDDSKSMRGERWTETRDALKGIADYAMRYNSDHVDLRFLNSSKSLEGAKGAQLIQDIFDEVTVSSGTPTGRVLKTVLNDQIDKLTAAVSDPNIYSTIRPLDIIFLTDGRPDRSEQHSPPLVLSEAVRRMREEKHHPNSIGIQFVQIGNDPRARAALMALIYGDNGSMVDTVPYDPNQIFNDKRLERILLGGLHPNLRALTQVKQAPSIRKRDRVASWLL